MEKTISISLAGRVYHLETRAHEELESYLAHARKALQDDPDATEVEGDLERAIAEKCDQFLPAHKNVITFADISAVLGEIGPVGEDADEPSAQNAHREKHSQRHQPRRLVRIREGAMIAGVANGFGYYFHLDPTIVRISMLVLTLVSFGFAIVAYVVLALIMPVVDYVPQHGPRVTTEDLMRRAGKSYRDFADSAEFKKWKEQIRRRS